ncbi:vesicle-associated membrane protein-associated protein B [Blastomyces gilchristii SLH14081]|uniref:Vesicle-associated membrane protein-associated protein B n=1 Tax=Blastomyces gilchristii (strain SLH14081) TaxID=559298 RepID=A0A179UU31_BLAGS|nr:vesicle-associated membrane protein-associated protein B [Blastomyces gilchristii SLH14081]OAT11313.1 vesicle-associated membrane protein-associated protein B [Blastomyces gilchristii SLH14081]
MSVNLITEDDRTKDPSAVQDPTAKPPQKFLRFQRPFTREVSQTLTIENNNDEPVAFKVKTTAPKSYCVRPNSGRIGAGESIDVQVLLQAMKDDRSVGTSKDKFLVQSVAVSTDKDFSNVSSIDSAETATAEINGIVCPSCRYLIPTGLGEDPRLHRLLVQASPEEEPPAYTSPNASKFDTPTAVRAALPDATSSDAPKAESRHSPLAAVPPKEDTASEELRSKLAEARAQIEKLRDQLADQGLGQRKISSTAPGSTSSGLQQHPPQPAEIGVPLRVVAGLCFLSFLLAYLFF